MIRGASLSLCSQADPLLCLPHLSVVAVGVAQSFALGSFVDADSTGPWSVTVDWGDGSTPTQFNVATAGVLPGQSHTYATAGTFPVLVTVSDGVFSGSANFSISASSEPGNPGDSYRYLPAIRP